MLLKPENKGALQAVLTYHVVAGNVTSADLLNLIRQGDGMATIETLQGGTLTAQPMGDDIVITDGAGRQTTVINPTSQRHYFRVSFIGGPRDGESVVVAERDIPLAGGVNLPRPALPPSRTGFLPNKQGE